MIGKRGVGVKPLAEVANDRMRPFGSPRRNSEGDTESLSRERA